MPLILLNKPFRVLSQFKDPEGRATLAKFVGDKQVYPAGRLDYDSEGLMLLTDDGALQAHISQPRSKLLKCYWVQVEGEANADALTTLINGVSLKDGPAKAIDARLIEQPEDLWPRQPPIRERKSIPTSWLSLSIAEGRNRQVRRMTAAAGYPALRLIRYRIGPWHIEGLQPGDSRSIKTEDAWAELRN